MVSKFFSKIFGSRNERILKKMRKSVDDIAAMEADIEQLDDPTLKAKTAEFRQRLNDGESIDDILPEAFAVVREASKRVLGMRHFDVQMIGGMVLNLSLIHI